MKKVLFSMLLAVMVVAVGSAQNYIVINSETIFKALPDYNKAVAELDSLAKQYQSNIDKAYKQVENMYNIYMQQKPVLTENAQKEQEDTIIGNEKKIAEYQESVFGQNGTLIKKRTEKLGPIQKLVFETIGKFAKEQGCALVLDVAANPNVVYYSPEIDKTQQIIEIITNQK